LRRAVRLVAVLNLGYFLLEFVVALHIGSVSLLADGVDFLEDAIINLLIFTALGWGAAKRARLGMALAGILLIPALACLWMLIRKVNAPVPPAAIPLSVTGLGALAINFFCAVTLARHRHGAGSLTKAAFLSSRNDAIANIGIIVAGLVTLVLPSIWPDIIVGLAIAGLNMDAARTVWMAARREQSLIRPEA
jgi:Co/Zn/Cd efflux system component